MPKPVIRVSDPGDLIASIPSMLTFPPQRSLVLILLRHDEGPEQQDFALIEAVARFDLSDDHRGLTRAAVRNCAHTADAIMAVIVDDRVAHHTGDRDSDRPAVIEQITKGFAELDVPLVGSWATSSITPGSLWWSLSDPTICGQVPDPKASIVAANSAAHGWPMRESRDAIAALLTPDPTAAAAVDAVMPTVRTQRHHRWIRAAAHGELDDLRRKAVEAITATILAIHRGEEITAEDLARIALELRDGLVRDVMLAYSADHHPEAAEALWLRLTRCLRNEDRADPATLLAISAYQRGDGPLASVALKAAWAADPNHILARLFESALQEGLSPHQIRKLSQAGNDAAATLGINSDQP
ncbi:DUF4192 domain-containing protein [Nocardia cyriacigeorgica]|uniref:DUF4192 domain-containing protein n=1 Tax=Nocardia cyriacigeorgica TaxID=135487 RepID=A0A5R8PAB5_9NOCA|nr:DUF4192 domain-containing protein [Nocardia cyriacigeorgica]TLG04254.1 DUF4192 domain-containing protein [Nocardia cyriacigeorgica]